MGQGCDGRHEVERDFRELTRQPAHVQHLRRTIDGMPCGGCPRVDAGPEERSVNPVNNNTYSRGVKAKVLYEVGGDILADGDCQLPRNRDEIPRETRGIDTVICCDQGNPAGRGHLAYPRGDPRMGVQQGGAFGLMILETSPIALRRLRGDLL